MDMVVDWSGHYFLYYRAINFFANIAETNLAISFCAASQLISFHQGLPTQK